MREVLEYLYIKTSIDFFEVICANCPALGIETLEYSGFENQLNRRNKLNFVNID